MSNLLTHEVAEGAGVAIATVKRAEKRGLIEARRDCNGWRRFSADAVQKLRQLYAQTDEQSEGR